MDEFMDMDAYLMTMVIFLVIFLVIMLVFYIVGAIAGFKYLKVRSYENAWIAFIPLVSFWALVEATYGDKSKLSLYGWQVPSVALKLWPLVTYALSIVLSAVPFFGGPLSILLTILNIAVLLMIYRDMMECLEDPQDGGIAIVAVVIHIIADIKVLIASGRFEQGAQDWKTDNRILASQARMDGPLSFLNPKK